jgi:hypothetical protein
MSWTEDELNTWINEQLRNDHDFRMAWVFAAYRHDYADGARW